MPAPHHLARRSLLRFSLRAGAILALTLSSILPAQPPAPPELPAAGGTISSFAELHDLYFGAHLTIQRQLSRKLDMTQEMLAEARYGEALPWLQELLETPEDTLRALQPRDSQLQSVKSAALQQLFSLPPAGRESYELQFGARAQRALQAALAEHDLEALAQVARRYIATEAGAAALWLWAQAEADQGHTGSAERLEAMLLADPLRRETYSALQRNTHASPSAKSVRQLGPPHGWPRWNANLLDTPAEDSRWRRFATRAAARNFAACPAAQPIVHGHLVAVRTPTKLQAIDAVTGRRVWNHALATHSPRWENALEDDLWNYERTTTEDSFVQQLRYQRVALGLSSDAQRLYAVANPTRRDKADPQREREVRFGERLPASPVNEVLAFQFDSKGSELWRTSETLRGSLAGAFFLGPPLSVEGRLLAEVEWRQTIHLIELDPVTGRLVWKQPLVNIERGVASSSRLRLSGAQPTATGGLLICPTGAGLVVGVDLVQRRLAWITRFPLDKKLAEHENLEAWQRQLALERQDWRTTGWQASRVLLAGNRALVATPESNFLYCLDIATGRVLWKQPQTLAGFVFDPTDDAVVIAEPGVLRCLELRDGSQRWSAPFNPGEALSGRGIVTPTAVLAPTTNSVLLAIDLESGSLARRKLTHLTEPLGNLVVQGTAIYSLSGSQLVRLDEERTLLATAERALGQNPTDAAANAVLGEAKLLEGDVAGAAELLRTALAATPTDATLQHRLATALLVSVRAGVRLPPREVASLTALLLDPQQRTELDVWRFRWAVDERELAAAIEIAMVQCQSAAPDELLEVGPRHRARRSHWMAASLGRLWREASPNERQQAAKRLQTALAELDPQHLWAAQLHFAELPISTALAEQRAEFVDATGRSAELALLKLAQGEQVDSSPALQLSPAERTAWARRQIIASVEPDSEQNEEGIQLSSGQRWQGIVLAAAPKDTHSAWSLAKNGRQLVEWNSRGEPLWTIELTSPVSLRSSGNLAAPNLWELGPVVIIETANGVTAYDRTGGGSHQLWDSASRRRTTDQGLDQAADQLFAGQDFFIDPPPNARRNSALPRIVSANASVVTLVEANRVRAIDTLTGELRWERSELPLEQLAATNEELLLADNAGAGQRLALRDGRTLGKWQAPQGERVAQWAETLALVEETSSGRELVLYDLRRGEAHWRTSLANDAEVLSTAPGEVLSLSADGAITLVDLASAQVRFTTPPLLPVGAKLAKCDGDETRYFVLASSKLTRPPDAEGAAPENRRLLTGQMVALDRQTGKPLWTTPAKLHEVGVLPHQPPASPLIFFAANHRRAQVGGARARTHLYALEKSTGRLVFAHSELPPSAPGDYHIQVETGLHPQVTFSSGGARVRLQLSALSAPPEPVADTGLAERSQQRELDLKTVGQGLQRVFDAAIVPTDEQDDD